MRSPSEKVASYLSKQPEEPRKRLNTIRELVLKIAPEAEETFSYGVPSFKLNGMLLSYAAFKNHIGFYPMPGAINHFSNELAAYHTSEGTIRFPLDKPLPQDLIERIIRYRIDEQKKK
jgi:uncharacterized protein YdhG (YjbR/CyaY superfamily)